MTNSLTRITYIRMTGQELLGLIHNVEGFFTVDGDTLPGVMLKDGQAWVFEDGTVQPIPKSELTQRGATEELSDHVAEMITPETEQWLKEMADGQKKNEFLNSIPLTKTETNTGDLPTKG